MFAAGAVGLVVYNNVPRLFRGVLRSQPESPVISLSQADGEAIEELLADSAIEAFINLAVESLLPQNVIAEKSGLSEATVVLGGHYDTVAGIAGANDNASGTAVFLTIARLLEDVDLPFTLGIVPFGSEEIGILGSRFYVGLLSDDDLENTKAMLNFGALGTGSGVTVFGDEVLTTPAAAAGNEVDGRVSVTRGMSGGTSDSAPFQKGVVRYALRQRRFQDPLRG